jgi:serine/threonine-protein kinase
MTRTGAVMGTPYYMAPEQAKGSRELDHRVDLYAAGVILYEAVTGEVPFNADTFNELLFKIVLEAARPVEQLVPNIDPAFAAIVNKSMAREPAARFQTAREFQQALEQWASGAGPQLAAVLNASTAAVPHLSTATPPHGALGTGQYAAANTAPGASRTLGTGTPGNWANTGAHETTAAAPKKSHTGLFVALGIVGVLVVGGGAALALTLGHKDVATAAKPDADAEKAKALEAEKAAQEAAAKAAAEAERAKAEAEQLKAEAEQARAAAEAAKNAPKPAAPATPAPAVLNPRQVALKAPAAKAEPKPATPAAPAPPATAAPASTGRHIRTTL